MYIYVIIINNADEVAYSDVIILVFMKTNNKTVI